MEEIFAPYEVALKFKEKGFEEECFGYWFMDFKGYSITYPQTQFKKWHNDKKETLALTRQQAIDWLDKKHGLGIEIALDGTLMWVWRVTPLHPKASYQQQKVCTYVHSTRNEAETEAIKEALNLII